MFIKVSIMVVIARHAGELLCFHLAGWPGGLASVLGLASPSGQVFGSLAAHRPPPVSVPESKLAMTTLLILTTFLCHGAWVKKGTKANKYPALSLRLGFAVCSARQNKRYRVPLRMIAIEV